MSIPASSVPASKSDFADWLSPILVKELRQGLRTKVFTVTFLVLQVLLISCVLIGLAIASSGGNTGVSSGFFWTIVGVPLLLILPWSGMNAVAREARTNTLDLIFLTRLSAWRIVCGKWIAIVAQSMLFLAAVLPYLVLRYFMGGVDIAGELLTLVLIMLGSILLSAALVGMSAYPGIILRIGIVVGMVIGVFVALNLLSNYMLRYFIGTSTGGGSVVDASVLWTTVGVIALFSMLVLLFGAARIAPAAENYAVRKRLLGLAILLVAVVARIVFPHSELVTGFAIAAIIPILIGSLCEEPAYLPCIYRPFVRRGFLGRVAGRFLYPGWPSGWLYNVAMVGAITWLLGSFGAFKEWQAPIAICTLAGAIFGPMAFIRLFLPNTRRTMMFFIIFQTSLVLLSIFISILDQTLHGKVLLWLSFIPTCGFVALTTDEIILANSQLAIALTGGGLAVSVLVLAGLSIRPFFRIAALEREVAAKPAPHDVVA